jgi:hypothetical protein
MFWDSSITKYSTFIPECQARKNLTIERGDETLGQLIIFAGMIAWVLYLYYCGPRTKTEDSNHEGGEDMNGNYYKNQGEIIDVGDEFTSFDQPFTTSERSLVLKRDKALEKASKKARLTWKDRKELRKTASQNLLELTQQTSDELREAMVAKFRSDLNFFVTAHNVRNMANLQKLKFAFEAALTEAYAESSKDRMNAKMRVLLSTMERMSRRVEDAKSSGINGNGKHAAAVIESFERLFQNTVREIEGINVRINQAQFLND